MSSLKDVWPLGQSFWLDNIERRLLEEGGLKALIDDGLLGVTSNPTIFEKALRGKSYDAAISDWGGQGLSTPDILTRLMVRDIQEACDLFLPTFQRTDGVDGFVSIEVSPHLAGDAEGTLEEAQRLWQRIQRPNVMIKIPATNPGIIALERALMEGMNVNVTLIFSLEQYRDVVGAYLKAMHTRAAQGLSLKMASVASFFISRIDTAVDRLLDARAVSHPGEATALKALRGQSAIASAKLAYQYFRKSFAGESWEALHRKGARPQRPLWASTSTKDPAYADLLYVEGLIGPDTVNTLPPATLEAFRGHGVAQLSLEKDLAQAAEFLESLGRYGVSLPQVTGQLLEEGLKQFCDSHDQLLAGLDRRRNQVEALS